MHYRHSWCFYLGRNILYKRHGKWHMSSLVWAPEWSPHMFLLTDTEAPKDFQPPCTFCVEVQTFRNVLLHYSGRVLQRMCVISNVNSRVSTTFGDMCMGSHTTRKQVKCPQRQIYKDKLRTWWISGQWKVKELVLSTRLPNENIGLICYTVLRKCENETLNDLS